MFGACIFEAGAGRLVLNNGRLVLNDGIYINYRLWYFHMERKLKKVSIMRNYSTISVSPATKMALELIPKTVPPEKSINEIIVRLMREANYNEQLERAKKAIKSNI